MASDDVSLDLEELRQLQSIAKRPHVLSLISTEIRSLEDKKLLNEAVEELTKPTSAAPNPLLNEAVEELTKPAAPAPNPLLNEAVDELTKPAAPAPNPLLNEAVDELTKPTTPAPNPVVNYVSLSSFSWEDVDDKVKMYIELEGVQKDKMVIEFKPKSFDIKFHDVGGKNYRCVIPCLFKEIVPEKCKVLVKARRLVIILIKASNGQWRDLVRREDEKLEQKLESKKDPMAGIMELMKNMYDKGDDDMKRTIAKAWTDARSGKTADPMKGFK